VLQESEHAMCTYLFQLLKEKKLMRRTSLFTTF